MAETGLNQENHHEKKALHRRFHEAWVRNWTKMAEADRKAKEEARDRLKNLSVAEIRSGAWKTALSGVVLTGLHGIFGSIGALMGFVGGGIGGAAVGAAIGGATNAWNAVGIVPGAITGGFLGVWTGTIAGSIGGYQAGVEAAGFVYEKYIRKADTKVAPLEKSDWIIGQLPGLNPVMVRGARELVKGYVELKDITQK